MAEQYQSREERRKKLQGKTKQKPQKKSRGLFKKILLSLVILGIVCIIAGVGTFAYLVKDTPPLDPKLLKDPIPSKILDKNGELVTEVGAVNREYVNYKDIPKVVENAILATEDYRFYKHHGIDPIRLGGAVLANFQHGFGAEGGSTITQQVVKNSFLTHEKTLKRKVQEAWLAYQLEQKYTKHQIFEMYVNKVFVSENSHGIATAAKIYYGKTLKELTLAEAAQIAGMPQSPNNYNPFTHPDLAEKRRNIVLSLMHQHGFITKKQMDDAMKTAVKDTVLKPEKRKVKDKPFDSFVDAVIDEVDQNTDFDIFTDGLTIYTTLDQNAQTHVEEILNSKEMPYPDENFQAGIALLDTKTGEIRAIGGGRNQTVKRGFNYAIDTQRQPGSTIKPVLDYGPAIEYLNWGTYQMIEDKPITYSTGKKFGNWDQSYKGAMTIRTALQLSRNSPAVQTLQEVGLDKAKDFAIGIGIPLKEIFESYAIGGFGGKTIGVSPLEMAGAYSAFGNNGIYTKPHAVNKIKLRDGTMISTAPEPKVAMKDSTAFMITDMLKSVLEYPGTGVRAKVPGLPIAGKTGTTNYTDDEIKKWNIPNSKAVPDSWFTGYTTNYTASIWTGYKDRSTPITAEGSNQRIAQLIFKDLMAYVSKDMDTPDFTMPSSVQKVRIERGSMPPVLASQYTPSSQVSIEYAVKGHAPKTVSKKYYKLAAPSNFNAKLDETNEKITLTWDYKNSSGPVTFDVSDGTKHYSVNDKTLTIPAVPGTKYNFTITAIQDSKKSDPVTTSLEVPLQENPNVPGTENGNENGQGNGSDQDQGNGNGQSNDKGQNDGSGQSNDKGQGNGSGQGNGTGQGNVNGQDQNPDQGQGNNQSTDQSPTEPPVNQQDSSSSGT
ncbi:transglycosylase domain-containing protein [Neobacillus mesonae]|uniref:transglycosylase domain-containing protein n=1 Tax=Neobacillus mesonae TaxID=1193713 RepID=UPI00203F3D11|nr:PBP1A family penicillin-binding protein [Neobacillus mesonae]MCM3566823.1 PBP1A family penicillin-binding protein [Neobacillus mesonae]